MSEFGQFFIGRERELTRLSHLLSTGPVTVRGIGGVGKTALLMHYAQVNTKYYHGGIFKINVSSHSVADELASFLQSKTKPTRRSSASSTSRVSNAYRHWKMKSYTLLIFDDVTEFSGLIDLMPPSDLPFHIVAITRSAVPPVTFREMNLEPLELHQAISLLEKIVGLEQFRLDSHMLSSLCERIEGIPLAITLCGHLLLQNKLSINQLLTELESRGLANRDPLDKRQNAVTINHGVNFPENIGQAWTRVSDYCKTLMPVSRKIGIVATASASLILAQMPNQLNNLDIYINAPSKIPPFNWSLPMSPSDLFAFVSAFLAAIQVWQAEREHKRSKQVFEQTFQQVRLSPQAMLAGQQMIVTQETLKIVQDRIEHCKVNFDSILLGADGGYSHSEEHEAARKMHACICRALDILSTANKGFPVGPWRDLWIQLECPVILAGKNAKSTI